MALARSVTAKLQPGVHANSFWPVVKRSENWFHRICNLKCSKLIGGSKSFISPTTLAQGSVPMLISPNYWWGGGGGEIWSAKIWYNKNVPNSVPQKCTKFCYGIFRTEAIFLGVMFSARGFHIPAQFALQAPFGRPVEGYWGLPLVVVHDG